MIIPVTAALFARHREKKKRKGGTLVIFEMVARISGEMIERSKNAVKNGSGVTARLHAGDGKKKNSSSCVATGAEGRKRCRGKKWAPCFTLFAVT